jgi:hypothetical protein
MIEVKELEDNSFEITWDENDPVESKFNTWTQEDFTNAIMNYCKDIIESEKQLQEIAEKLGGKLEHYVCSDLHSEHQKFVITYNAKSKG